MPLQLILVRHGETEWSRTGRHTGRTDAPLTERGRAEAGDAAETLAGWSIARVYTSPLSRARDSAHLVLPAHTPVVDEDLVEMDYGEAEGRTTAQMRETSPEWTVWTHPMAGGETPELVGRRAGRFLARVEEEVADGNVVVFAHGHLLSVLIARWCALAPIEGRRFALATATVSLLGSHHEDRVIRAINHRVGQVLDPPSRT